MALYMYQFAYTPESWAAQVKNPQNRIETAQSVPTAKKVRPRPSGSVLQKPLLAPNAGEMPQEQVARSLGLLIGRKLNARLRSRCGRYQRPGC